MNPCDPALAPVRCWEHEDCLEHPELAHACAGGQRLMWMAADACFNIFDPQPWGTFRNERGCWIDGYGGGDWPNVGMGAECGFDNGNGAGDGSGTYSTFNTAAGGGGGSGGQADGWQP